jgi:hypothetical protein
LVPSASIRRGGKVREEKRKRKKGKGKEKEKGREGKGNYLDSSVLKEGATSEEVEVELLLFVIILAPLNDSSLGHSIKKAILKVLFLITAPFIHT